MGSSNVINQFRHRVSQTPSLTYYEGDDTYQIQYEDVPSLKLKYRVAEEVGIRGIGLDRLDCLFYPRSKRLAAFSLKMSDAIPRLRGNK